MGDIQFKRGLVLRFKQNKIVFRFQNTIDAVING
jgi:hypothetical protein